MALRRSVALAIRQIQPSGVKKGIVQIAAALNGNSVFTSRASRRPKQMLLVQSGAHCFAVKSLQHI